MSCVFSWNIHNELITATNGNGDTAQYQYDALNRRTKRVETINGVATATWFLTNGWNVELEYENGAYARRMTWGQDLSGSLQGAGGVGGLVMHEELPPGGGAPVPSFPTFHGNGNITAWVNAGGTVIARQRFDAFGNIIEQTGTAPSRYGFSTKPIELVTGFLYYGYRWYDPITGRWPSRDPIEEGGGANLYTFAFNNSIKNIDYLGMNPRPLGDSDLNKPLVGGAYMIETIAGDVKIFRHKITCICTLYCFKDYEFEIYMDVSIMTGKNSRIVIQNSDKTVTRLGSLAILRFTPKTAPTCEDYGSNCKTKPITQLDYLLQPPSDNHAPNLLRQTSGVPSDLDPSIIPYNKYRDGTILTPATTTNKPKSSDQLP